MNNERIFIRNGKFVIIGRDEYETNTHFNMRGEYVLNNDPQNNDQYNSAIKKSRIWANKCYYNCQYNQEIEMHLKQ